MRKPADLPQVPERRGTRFNSSGPRTRILHRDYPKTRQALFLKYLSWS